MKICPCVFIQDNNFAISPPVSNVNQPDGITGTLFIGFDLQLDSGIFVMRKSPNLNGINSLSTVYFVKVSQSNSTLCNFPHQEQITGKYSTHFLLLQTKRHFICHWNETHFQSNTCNTQAYIFLNPPACLISSCADVRIFRSCP